MATLTKFNIGIGFPPQAVQAWISNLPYVPPAPPAPEPEPDQFGILYKCEGDETWSEYDNVEIFTETEWSGDVATQYNAIFCTAFKNEPFFSTVREVKLPNKYRVSDTEVTDVRYIGTFFFSHCENIEKVVIPDSIKIIGARAFEYCTGLSSVEFGNGVEYIKSQAFYNCESLSDVVLGSSVTRIGGSVFTNCINLSSISLPDSLERIDSGAFLNATFPMVTIPSSVSYIGEGAFCVGGSSYAKLKTVRFLGNAPEMEADVFYHQSDVIAMISRDAVGFDFDESRMWNGAKIMFVDEMTTITFDDGRTELKGIVGALTSSSITTDFAVSSKIVDVKLGSGVTSLGNSAFRLNSFGGYTRLASVTIPSTVTSIGSKAFYCPALSTITFEGNAPDVVSDSFARVGTDCKAIVPSAATGFDVDGEGKWNGLIVERR